MGCIYISTRVDVCMDMYVCHLICSARPPPTITSSPATTTPRLSKSTIEKGLEER